MSEILEKALEAIKQLSPQQKDRVGENILAVLDLEQAAEIPPEHVADVEKGLAHGQSAELATVWILFQKFFDARMRKRKEPFWQIIINDVIEVRQSAAEYITIIDKFFSEVSDTTKIGDFLSYGALLQKNINNKPPQKLLQSVKVTNLSISLFSSSIPVNHAVSIVKTGVETNSLLSNYQSLSVPNIRLAEKAYYTTQLAMNIYAIFLVTDELIRNVQTDGSEATLSDSKKIEHARKVSLEGVEKTERVLVGFRDKLRQTFFSKLE